jgi:hypothetical protein
MRAHVFACTVAVGVALIAGGAWAQSVTGTGTGPSEKLACAEARSNAKSQIPAGSKVKKYSDCLCRGRSNKSCTVSAEY